MEDFKSGLNPLSSENLSSVLITFIVMGTLLVLTIMLDKFLIPRLNPDNRFVKWWKRTIADVDPFEKK